VWVHECVAGGLRGKTINDLQQDVDDKMVYVVVTTKNNPNVRPPFSILLEGVGGSMLPLSSARLRRADIIIARSRVLSSIGLLCRAPAWRTRAADGLVAATGRHPRAGH